MARHLKELQHTHPALVKRKRVPHPLCPRLDTPRGSVLCDEFCDVCVCVFIVHFTCAPGKLSEAGIVSGGLHVSVCLSVCVSF